MHHISLYVLTSVVDIAFSRGQHINDLEGREEGNLFGFIIFGKVFDIIGIIKIQFDVPLMALFQGIST